MAILSSTGVSGFLSSAKATGKQILNKAGKLIPEYIEDFVSGFAGHGWKIWERVSGIWRIETDELVVRRTMIVFEMLISKIRCIKGALNISQGNGKIKTAELKEDGNWYITIEDEMSFVAHDIIRCQHFSNMAKFYWVEITDIINDNTTLIIPATEFMGSLEYKDGIEYVGGSGEMNIPEPGDEIIQFGNRVNKDRQSAIYLHADEGGQPAIDILFNINSKSFEGCLNMRMGGSIPGEGDMKGFYCENGMIKGTVNKHVVYQIKPDGSAMFGDGSAQFNADKSGYIAGGTISWEWDESKGKYVCTMQDVVLTWDNLSDEAKENLKGDKGEDGKNGDNGSNGLNGADGVDGKDGVSLVYKGELPSHPSDPQNGWYYRNSTDKKSYVYQDGAWYVMTVDGNDGKDGLDGINGENGNDGLDIIWKGDASLPPANPQKNWVYRDTDNGKVYIYNGSAWELMVSDGNNGRDGTSGSDGMSVYVTYHDSETEPAKPNGSGVTGGWHTNATNMVIWMSQKVAESENVGEWGSPIRIKGIKGDTGSQGIPGTPGKDGKVYYTWIRYADSVDGSGISNDPTGKKYIGLAYNREAAVESNIPGDYTWSLFRGEDGTDGVQGPTGTDGKTTYTWIAYSDNADGSGMYQLPNEHTQYIGIAVNKDTATESSNLSDYSWSKFKGDDAIVYELVPSTNVIAMNSSGRFTPDSVRCLVKKTVGAVSMFMTSEDITSDGLLFCWVRDDSGYLELAPGDNITPNNDLFPIAFHLLRNGESICSKMVVTIKDGEDGTPGSDANLLPWIEKWNGYATELGEGYIVTPKMFSGIKTTDAEGDVLLTGIAQGKECITIDGIKRTGIFALVDNEIVFELDPINKKYAFKGRVEADSGIFTGSIATPFIEINDDNYLSYFTPLSDGSGYILNISRENGFNYMFGDGLTKENVAIILPYEYINDGVELNIVRVQTELSFLVVKDVCSLSDDKEGNIFMAMKDFVRLKCVVFKRGNLNDSDIVKRQNIKWIHLSGGSLN